MAKIIKGAYSLFWSFFILCILVWKLLFGMSMMGGYMGVIVIFPVTLLLSAFIASLLARLWPMHVKKIIVLVILVAVAMVLV